eukprot:12858052-Heterocapsa_arctica.AAC.1
MRENGHRKMKHLPWSWIGCDGVGDRAVESPILTAVTPVSKHDEGSSVPPPLPGVAGAYECRVFKPVLLEWGWCWCITGGAGGLHCQG